MVRPKPESPEFVSISQAASIAGVDRHTVRKWIDAETLLAFRLPSGRLRVRRRDIIVPRNGK